MNKEITNQLIVFGILGVVVYYFVNKSITSAKNSATLALQNAYDAVGQNQTDATNATYGISSGMIINQNLFNQGVSQLGDLFGIGGTQDTHAGS